MVFVECTGASHVHQPITAIPVENRCVELQSTPPLTAVLPGRETRVRERSAERDRNEAEKGSDTLFGQTALVGLHQLNGA